MGFHPWEAVEAQLAVAVAVEQGKEFLREELTMGLFSSKRNPCGICGGATPRIFARVIEEQPLCSDCDGRIDMEPSLQDNLTLQSIKEHFVYLEENQVLRENFVISKDLDFGFFREKVIFDFYNKLFCMSGEPDKMVFSGSHLKSFTIKEDQELLFEGSSAGLKRYTSSVPDRVAALAPQMAMIRMTAQVANQLDQDVDNKNSYRPRMDLPEPFEEFHIELKLEHPYWQIIEFKVSGPDFNNTYPDANSYMREYDLTAAKLEELASSLMYIAFPDAEEMLVGRANPLLQGMATETPVDSIEEIRRFKDLLEEGIITETEFVAKKKQLLGI
ncbi:SHOCT domain-containing protein [Desulfitobacterium sp. THU1]|uniref:SHOCT domain-containing protein n=1 Tax=Desulfitobacterium sp. THU1 TaxID=3138072 RepID=UPI00311EE00D